MIVHVTFHIHPDNKQRAKDEIRKLRGVIERHGARNLKYYASMTSATPNRLFIYEIDVFAHFDSLNRDPEYQGVKLDSLYSNATSSTWGEVAL